MSSSNVPSIVAIVACAQLIYSSTFTLLKETFFSLEILDQMALVGLCVAALYSAVAVSQFIQGFDEEQDDHDHHNPPPMYPLKQLREKTTEREKFLCMFPSLRDSVATIMADQNEMPPEAVGWVVEMMDYTCPGGKLNRGMTVLSVVRTFAGDRELTTLEEARACVLGWAIEFLQAFFLVADDLMDESKTRRGQPCWYLIPKVDTIAVNDAFLLESFVFSFIKQHFKQEIYYIRLLELFLEVTQKTEFGQLLDLTSQPKDVTIIDFSRFTMDRYKSIVKYKTAYYSFYLPVSIGMIVSGVQDDMSHDLAERICCMMGEYFQVQDDYLDCYGTEEVIGKVGTDIQDNKCSWLVVQALARATPAQKTILQENYGKWDDAKVAKVKALYKEMELEALFKNYEEDSFVEIQEELKKVTTIPHDVFTLFLDKIYKRSK